MMNQNVILSSFYLPPIEYFSKISKGTTVYIESKANYIKQTYINRCEIYAANGKLSLSIPIKKAKTKKVKIEDVKISYDTNWQRLHLKSIESAYRSSAFYEYYIDAFIPFFTHKYEFLLDFNTDLLKTLLSELEIDTEIQFTDEYYKNQFEALDYRSEISSKNKNFPTKELEFSEYYQVFSKKYGFIPNLSIFDLIFNEGPNSRMILKSKK